MGDEHDELVRVVQAARFCRASYERVPQNKAVKQDKWYCNWPALRSRGHMGLSAMSEHDELIRRLRDHADDCPERRGGWCRCHYGELAGQAADALERQQQRIKEHEQFRHQHRDCDAMGVENQQLRQTIAELRQQLKRAARAIENLGGNCAQEFKDAARGEGE